MNHNLIKLEKELQPIREKLIHHPLYNELNSIQSIRFFMEQHVFAVWDFMSLLKALQRGLTSVDIPWTPSAYPSSRRLINEIVLGEESDVDDNGNPSSHYELYLMAMKEINADSSLIENFVVSGNWNQLNSLPILKETKQFVNFTFDTINKNELHKTASVFTFGREDLIPEMFMEIVKNVEKESDQSLSKMTYYLQRHIEVDSGEHGPMALNMIQELCGDDEQKWFGATRVAIQALEMRILLWDGVKNALSHLNQEEISAYHTFVK